MKSNVSPVAAIAIVAVFILVIGVFAWTRMSGGSAAGPGEKPPGMPPEVAAEFQKRMGTATPTGANANAQSTAPGTGATGSYIASPSSMGGR